MAGGVTARVLTDQSAGARALAGFLRGLGLAGEGIFGERAVRREPSRERERIRSSRRLPELAETDPAERERRHGGARILGIRLAHFAQRSHGLRRSLIVATDLRNTMLTPRNKRITRTDTKGGTQ